MFEQNTRHLDLEEFFPSLVDQLLPGLLVRSSQDFLFAPLKTSCSHLSRKSFISLTLEIALDSLSSRLFPLHAKSVQKLLQVFQKLQEPNWLGNHAKIMNILKDIYEFI